MIDINSEKNEIIVGPKKDLLKKEIILKDLNLLANKEIFNKEIFVKVRSTGKLLKSKLNIIIHCQRGIKTVNSTNAIDGKIKIKSLSKTNLDIMLK